MIKRVIDDIRYLLFPSVWLVFYTHSVFGQSVIEVKTVLETNPASLIREATAFQTLPVTEKSKLRLGKEPRYQSPKPIYRTISIGNVIAKQNVVVVVDEIDGQPPRIYVDANNNRNLTDDGSSEWTKTETGGFVKDVVIKATFLVDGKSQTLNLPFTAFRYRDGQPKQTRVVFQSKFARSGEIKIGDNAYKFVAQTFNKQGLFSDPKEVTIGIDTNRDGEISKALLSAEIFWGGEGGGKPFHISGESYRLARISVTGETMILEVSPTKVEPKKFVLINSPAPDFSFQTPENNTIELSALKGKVVLLDFWAIWCSPCIAGLPHIKKLYDRHKSSDFEIISVSLDGGESSETTLEEIRDFAAKEQMNWLIAFDNGGWSNAVAQIYNITGIPIHIVIDKKGNVRSIQRGGGTEKINKIEALVSELINE